MVSTPKIEWTFVETFYSRLSNSKNVAGNIGSINTKN